MKVFQQFLGDAMDFIWKEDVKAQSQILINLKDLEDFGAKFVILTFVHSACILISRYLYVCLNFYYS